MGIRINKVLGYGLCLTNKEYNQSYKNKLYDLPDQDISLSEHYAEYLTKKYKNADIRSRIPLSYRLLRSNPDAIEKAGSYEIIHEIEKPVFKSEANPELNTTPQIVLIFIPPFETHKWSRYDDDIDYVQHMVTHKNAISTVTALKHSPFPYADNIMNVNTGKLYPSLDFTFMTEMYKNAIKNNELTPKLEKSYDEFFQENYELSAAKALTQLTTAAVPTDMQDLAELIGLVEPGENFTHKLTPMLGEYWS